MSYANVKRAPLKLKGAPEKRQKREFSEVVESAAATLACTGRVVVSGTILQGLDTKFKEEIEIGDSVIIMNPQTHAIEERKVTAVMTNRSLNIAEKLSSDFVSTVTLEVRKDSIKLRRQVEAERRIKEEGRVKEEDGGDGEVVKDGTLEEAMKKQLDKNMQSEKVDLSYKQKTGTWGYRTVTEKVDRDLSREDLLILRSKKVHDKYC